LLEQLGLSFEVLPAKVDEARRIDERPGMYVDRLAREKAVAVVTPDCVVVAADTVVVHEGHVLGKPGHPEEARSMLRKLQGGTHEVFTGVAVAHGDALNSLVDVTEVRMLAMTDAEVAGYVDSGEPMDKAGAYALQGRGGIYVESLTGSPFTVIGLPIHLLPRLVRQSGADLERFGRTDATHH
jgi:septum formation protein